jgi:hypothetical protein
MADSKVVWVPNGYALGVGPSASLIPASERTVMGYFAGAFAMRTLADERQAMKQVVEAAGLPFELRSTATSRDRLGPLAYAAALGNARFALVPGGNSPETIRLYDALEMGSIPIMLRSPFVDAADALGGPPFPLLDDWAQLPSLYARFAGDDASTRAALDALHRQIIDWWTSFKRAQQQKLRERIDVLMAG